MEMLVVVARDHAIETYKVPEGLLEGVLAMVNQECATWAGTVAAGGGNKQVSPCERLLVDEGQAAEMLGISKRTVFNLNKRGELRARWVGSRKKYSVIELREFANRGGL